MIQHIHPPQPHPSTQLWQSPTSAERQAGKLHQLCSNISLLNSFNLGVIPFPNVVLLCGPEMTKASERIQSLLTNNQPLTILTNNFIAGIQYKVISTSPQGLGCQIHVFECMGSQDTSDTDYKYKRRLFSKLGKVDGTVYVAITSGKEDSIRHLGVHFIEEFDSQKTRSVIAWRLDFGAILREIQDLFLRSIRVLLVSCLRSISSYNQSLTNNIGELQQLQQINPIDVLPYLHKQHHLLTTCLVAELNGTFQRTRQINLKTPLRCLLLNRLQLVWEDDYTQTLKQLQCLTLREIEEFLMTHNTQLMHGFLSGNCFKSIFHPYMAQIQSALSKSLSDLVEITLLTIDHMVLHHLKHLSVKHSYAQMVAEKVRPLCVQFLREMSLFIHSQIEYIYISDQRYWKLSNINTSLYANSTFIELKYVGIAYIRRLAESLQEIIPKLVGDRLIGRVERLLLTQGLTLLQQLVSIQEVTIEVSTEEICRENDLSERLTNVKGLLRYFTRFVDSATLIPGLKGKVQRMLRGYADEEPAPKQQVHEHRGLLYRIKKLFSRDPEGRRASSQDRVPRVAAKSPPQIPNLMLIRQAQWLIALNTSKRLDPQRIEYSAKQGFPDFLRPAIWLHLCQLQWTPPSIKQLLASADTSSRVYGQILKDVKRTPPPELFALDDRAQTIMKEVLLAYSIYDPEVGYVQGMNFIVSMIIRTIINYGHRDYSNSLRKHEQNRFTVIGQQTLTILAYVVKKLNWRQYYVDETPRLIQSSLQIEGRIKREAGNVWDKMQSLSVSPCLLFTEALMTILTARAPLEFAQRIFDYFLIKGQSLIQDVIIKLIGLNEKSILEANSPGQLFSMLREGIFKSVISAMAVDEILAQ